MTESTAIQLALPIRIYIEDTDAGGIVFYANYLKYFERARTELVRRCGIALRSGLADNINYVVCRVNVAYHRPARLDDEVIACAKVMHVGRTYIDFEQWVESANGETMVTGEVRVACVNLDDGRPRRLPENLRYILAGEDMRDNNCLDKQHSSKIIGA